MASLWHLAEVWRDSDGARVLRARLLRDGHRAGQKREQADDRTGGEVLGAIFQNEVPFTRRDNHAHERVVDRTHLARLAIDTRRPTRKISGSDPDRKRTR